MKINKNKRVFGIHKNVYIPSVIFTHPNEVGVERHEIPVIGALLARCWGDKVVCHPSIRRLAKDLGYAVDKNGRCSSVGVVLKGLRVKGLVEITRRNRKTSFYDISPLLKKCGEIEKRLIQASLEELRAKQRLL
jgi:hypothetical protein